MWVNQPNPITDISMSSSTTNFIWGDPITLDTVITGGDGDNYYYALDIKQPGQDFVIDPWFESHPFGSPIVWSVPSLQPGSYRIRIRVIDELTDKPVASNRLDFTITENTASDWQSGGQNHTGYENCSIYDSECLCEVFLYCGQDNGGQ